MLPSGRRRSLHEQGHNTEDLRMVARSFRIDDAEQMVVFNTLCNSPLVVQYFLEHFVLLPSTSTLDHTDFSLRPRCRNGRTSALRAVPWLHEHSERFVVEADGRRLRRTF